MLLAMHPNGYTISPGKGWNVITVGGSDDRDTCVWSDDIMYSNSTWMDPVADGGEVLQKPEIVAPATSIDVITHIVSGTSIAAPQVAGEAALLYAESSDNYATDHLDTDLNLQVEYFGVNWVLAPDGYSASFHSSYELWVSSDHKHGKDRCFWKHYLWATTSAS